MTQKRVRKEDYLENGRVNVRAMIPGVPERRHSVSVAAQNAEMLYEQEVPAQWSEIKADDTGPDHDMIWMLECNVDDCGGEAMGYVLDLLFAEGAKDVWFSPIFMKKNRPAYTLHVICGEAEREELEHIIFSGTTTIGIRRVRMERTILKRFFISVDTDLGTGTVKMCRHRDRVYAYPEYESVKKICQSSGMDYQSVYHLLKEAAIRYCQKNGTIIKDTGKRT